MSKFLVMQFFWDTLYESVLDLGLSGEDYIIKHDMKLVHKLRNLLGEGGRGSKTPSKRIAQFVNGPLVLISLHVVGGKQESVQKQCCPIKTSSKYCSFLP